MGNIFRAMENEQASLPKKTFSMAVIIVTLITLISGLLALVYLYFS